MSAIFCGVCRQNLTVGCGQGQGRVRSIVWDQQHFQSMSVEDGGAGAQILMNEYLSAEYLTAIAQQSRLLTENFQHATLCIDRYIGNAQQFLYSIVVQRPDGKAALLDIVNLAEMRFAAEQLRGVNITLT
jgi:hypothetical protein